MSHFEPFLAYEASAGSGKTFNLVVRYLSLLFMGEEVETITALTFTNKAANEMRTRVVETLHALEKRGELAEIAKVSGLSEDEILASRDKVLWKLLRSDMKISTIDTFFGSILRKFALNAGIMPTFTASNAHHEVKFLKRFLHEVEIAGEMGTLTNLSQLSSKRLEDIFTLLSTLYAKHKELEGLSIPKISLSFDPVAHAMAYSRELSELILSKPLSDRARKTMRIEDYEDLLKKSWLFKQSLEYWDFKKIYEPKMDALLHKIQETVLTQMQYREAELLSALNRILKIYIKSRHALIIQNNELTFDDITLMVHDLLRGKLESEFLYFRLDAAMKHLLLDEFQDTSVIQFDILRPLIEEIAAGIGVNEGGSFFFVGDVKQSIYRFRGGVSALFYQVAQHFDVQVQPLEVNYRSRSEVVAFVNRVFGSTMERYISQSSPSHKSGGWVEVRIDEEPLNVLLKQIDELRQLGIHEDDIAVLCGTNSDATRAQEALEEQGIPVVSEATSRLIHQRSVRAIIEYLRYCYFGNEIYRQNCAALLGEENIERQAIVEVQSQCVEFILKYGIGDKSAILFIEKLSQYADIEAVIFEIDRLEASSPQSDLHGIRIMTVHKSKGLEFEHVIVLDRLGQMKSRNDFIMYEYDGIHLEHMFIRTKGREELDNVYKNGLEKEQKLEQSDQLNALYVALTRAIQSLTIIAKPKSSWFEPLALSAGSWGEHLFETTPIASVQPLKYIETKSVSYGKQSNTTKVEKNTIIDYEAINYGLALHYALEMMGNFESESLKNALESTRKRYGMNIGEAKIGQLYQTLHTLITDEQFRFLTRGKSYKEQAFYYQGQKWIIDLLIEHDEGYWVVIDYKSGEEKSVEHTQQVKNYMDAVGLLLGREVRGYVCYARNETCEWQKVV
ncbi:MAG: RecB-like helicase [Sulfuricurvum sp.]|nr:RecB-like helicase [Sulfuricurvum sp.]